MNSEKLDLDLLGALSENHGATQRDLAARLGIALGLTNALIKRLARKGYIKITHVSPRRVRYLVTPKGILEKSRLTYSYIQFSIGYYRDLRTRLHALFDRLARDGRRRVVLFGAGEVAEIALICAHGGPLEIVAIVDERPAGRSVLGRAVEPLDALRGRAFDALVLTTPAGPERFADRLARAGVAPELVWGLDGAGRAGGAKGQSARGGHGTG